jgi:hypothetical protein
MNSNTKITLGILSFTYLAMIIFFLIPYPFSGLDVGDDTKKYQEFYDIIVLNSHSFSIRDYFIREPLFVLLFYVSSIIGLEFLELKKVIGFFYIFVILLIYGKVDSRNFIVFSSFFLAYFFLQGVWSTLRFGLAFFIISLLISYGKKGLSFLISPLFHYSFILFYLNFLGKKTKLYAPFCLLFVAFSYTSTYISAFDIDSIKQLFLGSFPRLFLSFFSSLLLIYILGFLRKNIDRSLYFFSFIFMCSSLIPLGWRITSIFLPILLISNLSHIRIDRILLFSLTTGIIFIYKMNSHYLSEVLAGNTTTLDFIIDFYFH